MNSQTRKVKFERYEDSVVSSWNRDQWSLNQDDEISFCYEYVYRNGGLSVKIWFLIVRRLFWNHYIDSQLTAMVSQVFLF